MNKKLSLAEEAALLEPDVPEIDYTNQESLRAAVKAGQLDADFYEDRYGEPA